MSFPKIGFGAALAMVAVLAAGPARADCNANITKLKADAATVTDPRLRKLIEFDVTRALKEADEDDDDECQEAIDHAHKLMASAKPSP